jgi:DNA-binding transcriptional ArsR family regulator
MIRISISPAFQTITAALMAGPAEPVAIHAAQTRLVRRAGRLGEPLTSLLALDGSHLPDFLTPCPTTDNAALSDELEIAASAPAWRITRDSRHLEPFIGRSTTAEALVGGDRQFGNRVIGAVFAFHRAAYGDSWGEVRTQLRVEVDRRRRDLDVHGVDYVLSTIHPSIRWRWPVLTISNNSYDGDYERHGQGIVLIPGVGRLRTVTTMINPWEPVTIGYPVAIAPYAGRLAITASPQLVRLLGHTKARVLTAIESSPDLSTTQLAAHLGISPASASEHASVLRSAGLITSTRDRNAVRHTLLPLGAGVARASRNPSLREPTPRPWASRSAGRRP